MIRSSPCTSTSCWSSGENSTWSPTLTCRTLAPTARASPHTSRLATWAVAGMRMPPVERRSPSSLRRATRIRSCSILIGSPPFFPAEEAASGTSSTLPGGRSAVLEQAQHQEGQRPGDEPAADDEEGARSAVEAAAAGEHGGQQHREPQREG